jgi:hypothetical protein
MDNYWRKFITPEFGVSRGVNSHRSSWSLFLQLFGTSLGFRFGFKIHVQGALDLPKSLNYLLLSDFFVSGFGAFHVTGFWSWYLGYLMLWLTGRVQPVAPAWGPDGFNPFNQV